MIRLHNNIKIECIMMRKDMRERERRMYNRYWQWTMNRRWYNRKSRNMRWEGSNWREREDRSTVFSRIWMNRREWRDSSRRHIIRSVSTSSERVKVGKRKRRGDWGMNRNSSEILIIINYRRRDREILVIKCIISH